MPDRSVWNQPREGWNLSFGHQGLVLPLSCFLARQGDIVLCGVIIMDALIVRLKEARDAATYLRLASTRERILGALRCADGAQRHLKRRMMKKQLSDNWLNAPESEIKAQSRNPIVPPN